MTLGDHDSVPELEGQKEELTLLDLERLGDGVPVSDTVGDLLCEFVTEAVGQVDVLAEFVGL